MAKKSENSQRSKVLKYLNTHGSITSWHAFMDLGVTRLSSIIYTLRKEGIPIKSVTIRGVKNKYGNAGNYSKYYIDKEGGDK